MGMMPLRNHAKNKEGSGIYIYSMNVLLRRYRILDDEEFKSINEPAFQTCFESKRGEDIGYGSHILSINIYLDYVRGYSCLLRCGMFDSYQ